MSDEYEDLYFGELAETAVDLLASQGLYMPARPEFEMPVLIMELTDLGDPDLMELYAELTAWADYVSVQVQMAAVNEREAEKRLSSKTDRMMLGFANGGKSEQRVTFAKAQISGDEDIIALKEKVDTAYAYRKLIEALFANIERDTFIVSRELTRRTATATGRREYTK